MSEHTTVPRGIRSGEVSQPIRNEKGEVIGHESVYETEQLQPVNVKNANATPSAQTVVTDNSNAGRSAVVEVAELPKVHGGGKRPEVHQHGEYVKPVLDTPGDPATVKTNH